MSRSLISAEFSALHPQTQPPLGLCRRGCGDSWGQHRVRTVRTAERQRRSTERGCRIHQKGKANSRLMKESAKVLPCDGH